MGTFYVLESWPRKVRISFLWKVLSREPTIGHRVVLCSSYTLPYTALAWTASLQLAGAVDGATSLVRFKHDFLDRVGLHRSEAQNGLTENECQAGVHARLSARCSAQRRWHEDLRYVS